MGNPSSMMKPVLKKSGTAPLIATSFTVPFTARQPMSPPGKKDGVNRVRVRGKGQLLAPYFKNGAVFKPFQKCILELR